MQNSVQKTDSIRFGNGILKFDNVNLWLLENAQLDLQFETVEIVAHNGRLPVKKRISTIMFNAELYEFDLTNFNSIIGHGTLANTAASPVSVTGEALGTWWTVGQPIKLANKNGANTIVTSIVIDADASPLTVDVDYDTYVGDGTNGELGYTYIVPLTSQAGVLDADYDYTPNASKKITYSDLTKLVNYGELVFENTNASGKVFKITIPKSYSNDNMVLSFVSDDAVDEVMKVPVAFKAYPDDNNKFLEIYDEQSVS